MEPATQLQLLDFDGRASGLEFLLELLGLFLRHRFLDGLRGAFDEVLRFLQAQAGDGADSLDDFDLLLAGGLQDDGEFGLLFDRGSGSGRSRVPPMKPITFGVSLIRCQLSLSIRGMPASSCSSWMLFGADWPP